MYTVGITVFVLSYRYHSREAILNQMQQIKAVQYGLSTLRKNGKFFGGWYSPLTMIMLKTWDFDLILRLSCLCPLSKYVGRYVLKYVCSYVCKKVCRQVGRYVGRQVGIQVGM